MAAEAESDAHELAMEQKRALASMLTAQVDMEEAMRAEKMAKKEIREALAQLKEKQAEQQRPNAAAVEQANGRMIELQVCWQRRLFLLPPPGLRSSRACPPLLPYLPCSPDLPRVLLP